MHAVLQSSSGTVLWCNPPPQYGGLSLHDTPPLPGDAGDRPGIKGGGGLQGGQRVAGMQHGSARSNCGKLQLIVENCEKLRNSAKLWEISDLHPAPCWPIVPWQCACACWTLSTSHYMPPHRLMLVGRGRPPALPYEGSAHVMTVRCLGLWSAQFMGAPVLYINAPSAFWGSPKYTQ